METANLGTTACRRSPARGVRCKGVIVLVLWLAAAAWCQPAAAQSWQTLLKDVFQSLGGSASEKPAQEKAAVPVPPSAKELQGVWTYQAPAISYTGSDMLATLAVATLESQLPAYYQQAGLLPGAGTFAFGENDVFEAVLGAHRITGTYGYAAAAGEVSLSFPLEGKQVSFKGRVTLADDVLTLMFEASETLRTLRAASAQFAQNQKVQQISAILDAYPGIMLGAKMKK